MGQDGSDVYLFEHVDGGIECCFCTLGQAGRTHLSPRFQSADECLDHLQGHEAVGHHIPKWVVPEIKNRAQLDPHP